MSIFQFGFLGCGNMGSALALAVAKSLPCDQIAVSDASADKLLPLAKASKATAATVTQVAAESKFIFVAVKPQIIEELFAEIAPILQKRTDRFVLVSMAAGVSIKALEQLSSSRYPIIRMMPNTPVGIGKGMTVYAANNRVTEQELAAFTAGLSACGRLDRIPEGLIDAAGALSGCGPAFVYLFAEALADGGVACGLPRDKALLYAAQTLSGAAEMLLQSGKHPGELKDAVCSPGGTTIAGVQTLERNGFRASAMDAVTAAFEKTKALKK